MRVMREGPSGYGCSRATIGGGGWDCCSIRLICCYFYAGSGFATLTYKNKIILVMKSSIILRKLHSFDVLSSSQLCLIKYCCSIKAAIFDK